MSRENEFDACRGMLAGVVGKAVAEMSAREIEVSPGFELAEHVELLSARESGYDPYNHRGETA